MQLKIIVEALTPTLTLTLTLTPNHLRRESHVEHAVGLVQRHVLTGLQAEGLLAEEVHLVRGRGRCRLVVGLGEG